MHVIRCQKGMVRASRANELPLAFEAYFFPPHRSSLTADERLSYIDAVLCLQRIPSLLPAGLVPGAVSRFDDFVATHINNTIGIHLNGKFLSWHRQFVWLYEKALQQECGYTGTQP